MRARALKGLAVDLDPTRFAIGRVHPRRARKTSMETGVMVRHEIMAVRRESGRVGDRRR
uniref:Uncharacterized protein n=1 Tax=Hyaloperonospora arabidopsidis (strain Emoy2) TaxID=559515 RepID=M4BZE3_HYAAE